MGKVNLVAVTAVALVLAGCAGGGDDETVTPGEPAPNIVQPGAPGEPTRTLTPEELTEIEPTLHTKADVRFMQGMIHHHAQALRMTALVAKRSDWPDLSLLAKRMDISQEAEIDQMRRWLVARSEPAPELHRLHGHAHGIGQELMPGMLTEPELRRLGRAKGRAFDRLFLQFMIRHHRGAVEMVRDLYAANGGLESEVDAFARHVDSDQLIEIARMEEMLARLDTE